jgi:hypothetical protein
MPVSRNSRKRIRIQESGSVGNSNNYYVSTHIGKKVGDEIIRVRRKVACKVGIRFPKIEAKLSDTRGRYVNYFKMDISYVGDGELEGILHSNNGVEIIVHARNRANLVRKARRVLHEKHGINNPICSIPKPSVRIEGVVL